MAGAGVRVFQAGEVLTATLVNTYLQDQVVARFASASARDAAFGGSGEPTLEEGRVCYLDDTNVLQYYSGSAWIPINSEAVISQIQAKGDLVVGTGSSTISRVAVGANDTILVADSTTASGVAWKAPSVAAANSITSAQIVTGTIVNANVSASAAIELSKLANATAGQVLLGTTTTGVVTATTISGDVTVTGAGVTAISSGAIVNADVNASAAIDLGKLADATIDEQASSYTLALTDKNKFIKMTSGSANTVTVPTNASVAFPIGSQIHIIQYGSGKTQVIPVSGTVTIDATPGAYLRAQYSSATLLKCDTNIWMLMGDLSAS